MDTKMKAKIKKSLALIEKEHDIKILYAVESGSRAWGFPSEDSDYDVRFIYVHTKEWYLSIAPKRDVIEYPIDDELDISGWDLQKALKLLRKSNPSLIEWLNSSIIYLETGDLASQLRTLAQTHVSQKQLMYHYYHMARGNFRDYLQGEHVKIKKYFYVLRPVLACLWLEKYQEAPPVLFNQLLTLPDLDSELIAEVKALLIRKKRGDELDLENQNPILNQFIEEQLTQLEVILKSEKDQPSMLSYALLDELFTKYML